MHRRTRLFVATMALASLLYVGVNDASAFGRRGGHGCGNGCGSGCNSGCGNSWGHASWGHGSCNAGNSCAGGLCNVGYNGSVQTASNNAGTGDLAGNANYSETPPDQAQIVVNLPADAQLLFDGQLTRSTSSRRVFETPRLDTDSSYGYTIEARLPNGAQVTRKVSVTAGSTTVINLSQSSFQSNPSKNQLPAPGRDSGRSSE